MPRGQLQQANVSYYQAHTVLLPSVSHLLDFIIFYCHEPTKYKGVTETLTPLREITYILRATQS